jgi:hypothetical protein
MNVPAIPKRSRIHKQCYKTRYTIYVKGQKPTIVSTLLPYLTDLEDVRIIKRKVK